MPCNTIDFQPSYELLAVLHATADVREELSRDNHGQYFVAFTDGSCSQRDSGSAEGPGGWGAILFSSRGKRWEMQGHIEDTTSNRAEVCALLAAVSSVPEGTHLGVQSDSRYTVDRVRANCHSNDNTDLWEEVREMLVAKDIKLTASWVAGHKGHCYNERVDALASIRG